MSNSDRTEHGKNAQDSLEAVMQHCLDLGYIKSITPNYRIGLQGYSDDTQFYAPFLIEFDNGNKWAIYSTTSMRDRFKGQLWDAYFLKRMQFTPIDLATYPHRQLFHYFSGMAPTGYSMTVPVDVTALRGVLQAAGLKFFPAYLWLITKNLNRQAEFKMAQQDGVLGYYDTLTPLYAAFHEDDHTFSLMWTAYQARFLDFYQAYLGDQARFGGTHGVLCQPETPPPSNAYTVSCIPWIGFTHFAVHSYENKAYYFPSVEAGKFYEQDGRVYMPLSLTCHHAATDGYHVKCFLADLNADMAGFEQYLA